MDWLKDKKNQPIVAGILIGVIVLAGVGVWLMNRPAAAPTDQTGAPAPGMEATAPGAPTPGGAAPAAPALDPNTGMPVTAAAQTPAPAAASAPQAVGGKPMETWRGDPFQPIGYKPRPVGPQPKPAIRDFPFEPLPGRSVDNGTDSPAKQQPEIAQPSRRMAGILLNDRVFAIIESNGVSQVVQPGDYTTDRLATVVRIEPDRVVLKTVDKKPRFVTVRMAASPIVQAPVATNTSIPGAPAMPGGGRMGPMPPMPMAPSRGGPPPM